MKSVLRNFGPFHNFSMYSNFRNYAPPLDVKGGIITEKVFPVFSECFFWTCFGQNLYLYRSEVLVLVSAQLVAVATSQKTRMDEFDQGDVLSHTAVDAFDFTSVCS